MPWPIRTVKKGPVPLASVTWFVPFVLLLNPQAAASNSKEAAELLLQRGADIDLQNSEGYTALMWVSPCAVPYKNSKEGPCAPQNQILNIGARALRMFDRRSVSPQP